MIETFGTVRRGGHRAVWTSTESLFDAPPTQFDEDGIRLDLSLAVKAAARHRADPANVYAIHRGGHRHSQPLRPIIRRQARASLRTLGLLTPRNGRIAARYDA